MSWSKNYTLASVAHRKLEYEAKRSEHVLRRLVAHANLLDSILEDLDHLAIEPRTNTSSQGEACPTSDQATCSSDTPEVFRIEDVEEDNVLKEDLDECDCASIDTDDKTCDIFHTLHRSPPRHVTNPLVRDFADVTQPLSPGSTSVIGPMNLSAIEEQSASTPDVEGSNTIDKQYINVPLSNSSHMASSSSSLPFALMPAQTLGTDSLLDENVSPWQAADRSPTEFGSNFEEALMWQLATQSVS